MNAPAPSNSTVDFSAIKQRQQAMWAAGDYAVVGTTLQIVGEQLCEAVDMRAGERVLDVAAGNGNATLAAARRFADVTSTDYVGALLDRAKERAKAINAYETFATKWKDADAPLQPQVRFARDAAQRLRDPRNTVPVRVAPGSKPTQIN